jgi:hypothetical protein
MFVIRVQVKRTVFILTKKSKQRDPKGSEQRKYLPRHGRYCYDGVEN